MAGWRWRWRWRGLDGEVLVLFPFVLDDTLYDLDR